MQVTKEQAAEVKRLTGELQENPQFILPAGYKKIPECVMDDNYGVSSDVGFIPIAFQAAIEVIDYILSKAPLNIHVVESISKQKTQYKVKATGLISPEKPRERAMSTLVPKKSPVLLPQDHPTLDKKKPSISPAIQSAIKDVRYRDRPIAKDAALTLE